MDTYHLSLLYGGKTVAFLEIEADGNAEAAVLGTAVFQSCRAVCDGFEVRRGIAWIAAMSRTRAFKELNLSELPPDLQERVAQITARILESQTTKEDARGLYKRTPHRPH